MFYEPIQAVHFAQQAQRLFDPLIMGGSLGQIGERIGNDTADLPSFPMAQKSS
jgi:hypothetical protein